MIMKKQFKEIQYFLAKFRKNINNNKKNLHRNHRRVNENIMVCHFNVKEHSRA